MECNYVDSLIPNKLSELGLSDLKFGIFLVENKCL